MDGPPSLSQRPQSFHPDFDREVYTVIFSVEGQGFKVDASRLTAHSDFLRKMLFDTDGHLGISMDGMKEGTVDNPIVVLGCTAGMFANFLGWLNHNSWLPHRVGHCQQLLDILHVSHMWEIQPGIEFATRELLTFNLHPAQSISLARQYQLLDWIAQPVQKLLDSPLEQYTHNNNSTDMLDYDIYMIIATAKESIATERKRLGNHPPFPPNFDSEPFCAQHNTCKRVWTEKWFFTVVRRIHHPTTPLPLSMVPEVLAEIDHRGMNTECKRSILTWLRDSCVQVRKEDTLIQDTIATVRNLFTQ